MKLLVTGDTQRPGDREMNIHWFWNLCRLRDPKAEIFTHCTRKWTKPEWIQAVKGEKGLPLGDDETEVVEYAKACGVDRIWGFEMPQRTLDQLDQAGIGWNDFQIHPVRFGPDVLFMQRVSSASDHVMLREMVHNVWEYRFRQWALLEKARCARINHDSVVVEGPLNHGMEPFALVIGQVPGDRNMLDFPGWDAIVKEFPKEPAGEIFFKRHPYDPDSPGPAGIPEIYGNVYNLLGHPALQWVGGWNSSVLAEARYFDVPVYQLGPSWWEKYVATPLADLAGCDMPMGYLRRTMRDKWSYQP